MNSQVARANSKHIEIDDASIDYFNFSVEVPKYAKQATKHSEVQLYNLNTDVVFQGEVLQQVEISKLYKAAYFSLFAGVVALVIQMALKLGKFVATPFALEVYTGMNVLIAGADLVVMLVCTTCYIIRVVEVTRRGFVWSQRRRRQAILNVVQVTAHSLNCILYVAPNVVTLAAGELARSSTLELVGFGRYTLWNIAFLIFVMRVKMLNPWVDSKKRCIGREDAIIMDAPWMHHWHLYLSWIAFQCAMVLSFIVVHMSGSDPHLVGKDRGGVPGTCTVRAITRLYMGLIIASLVTYQIAGLAYIYRGCCRLKEKPYNLFRGINISIRYHFLNAAIIGNFILFSMIVLFWVKHSSCETAYLTLLGLLPPHLVMTALSVANCIMDMPVKPGRTITLSVQSDQFEWLETQARTNSRESKDLCVINKFCFELSVKLWYWCLAIYGYDPTTQECHDPQYPQLCFSVAMDMFGFQHHEFIKEEGSDIRILIAWNDHTILVCFRGTYSFTNVWSDLQSWRVIHPPKRGNYFFRSQPLVHRGFLACWERSKLNQRVVARVKDIMDGESFDQSRLRMLVTGHSMGGALAVLASHDLATNHGIGNKTTCYTYGAPRVGNHAFVREYNAHVPNTWQVVNDEDLVPSIPKFLLLYKHAGEKVIINGAGDMIVKPHTVEVSLYRICSLFEKSIRITQHLLLGYRESFVAICEAQYKHGKALKGGKEAMDALLEKREKLLCNGLNVDPSKLQDLHQLGSNVWTKGKTFVENDKAMGCGFWREDSCV